MLELSRGHFGVLALVLSGTVALACGSEDGKKANAPDRQPQGGEGGESSGGSGKGGSAGSGSGYAASPASSEARLVQGP